MEFFCNKNVNYKKFITNELKTFINENNCWINLIKDKNLVYIHTYDEYFFNRKRYKSFFDKTYFKRDLEPFNFKNCDQKYSGICDYEILNNMDKLISREKNNFVIFLTVNNHIPLEPFYKNSYIDCKENFPLIIKCFSMKVFLNFYPICLKMIYLFYFLTRLQCFMKKEEFILKI